MGTWNTHGMVEDEDEQLYAISVLGMLPEELDGLAEYSKAQAWIYDQLRKHSKSQEKRKAGLIAGHWRRRYRQLKRLAALLEEELTT